jgi:hypothetical protein
MPGPARPEPGKGEVTTPAFLLPIAGAVWLALSSVATTAFDSARPPAQRTVPSPGDQNDELTQLRRNAERGDRQAQFSLGLIYEAGEGTGRDDAQAAEWYQKAADQGRLKAISGLMSSMAEPGATAGVRWFRRAADNGLWAQCAGADLCLRALVPKDDVKPTGGIDGPPSKALRHSSASDDAPAKAWRKALQAIQWYRKAAVGDANAQYELGVMFATAKGSPDDAEAAKWCRKGRRQGHGAQFSLGCLRDGQGVAQDLVWFAATPGVRRVNEPPTRRRGKDAT